MSILKIGPVGGVGQIGSNCTFLHYKKHKILIDCGILFPNEDFFDLNYLIPNLDSIDSDITDIIITHGHEDHIGAIHHFVEKFPSANIFAPKFAKALMEHKLNARKISKKINDLELLKFDDLSINPIHVNHSIPDTKGLLINVKDLDTSMLFISDFKYDETSPYEPAFEIEKIKSDNCLNRRIAFLDSTNMLSGNLTTPSEAQISPNFERVCEETSGNVFITTFSSNIHRIQSIINTANKFNRAVIPYGRSMNKYIETALKLDLLNDDQGVLKDADDKSVKKKKIIICSGCQGEHRGSAKRIISGNDTKFKLTENDSFVFSSKAIPGNEKKISHMYNAITEAGANLITPQDLLVHVSGHPGRDDLRIIYNAFKPQHAFPIHGETAFLQHHVDFVLDNKLTEFATRIKNGDCIEVSRNDVKVKAGEVGEPTIIHGADIEIERERISQRRKMATLGSIFISVSVESINRFKLKPSITFLGLPKLIDDSHEELISILHDQVAQKKSKPLDQKLEAMRIATRRYYQPILGYRPLVIVHIC